MGQNLEHCQKKMRQNPGPYHNVCTIDFTSDGMPVGVASGSLWLVRLATFILQSMEHTSHKFSAETATGIPSEVKSTVPHSIQPLLHCLF